MKTIGFILMCLAGMYSAHFIPGGPLVALFGSLLLVLLCWLRRAWKLSAFFAIPGLSALWWYGLIVALPNGGDAGPGSYQNLVEMGWLVPLALLAGILQMLAGAVAVVVGMIGGVLCVAEMVSE